MKPVDMEGVIMLDSVVFQEMSFNEFPEIIEFEQMINSFGSIPYFKINEGLPLNLMRIEGKDFINFSSYNYLGLNGNEEVMTFTKQAIDKYGTSVSASRLVSGEIDLHRALEQKIAQFLCVEDSLVQVGGYVTNVDIVGNVVDKSDLILIDSYAHRSIIEGTILSQARVKTFRHNDMAHLALRLEKLRSKYRRVLIVVEGIYSMDGDICRLPELVDLKKRYGAILMVDEAHSLGTIGKNGRGVTSHFGIDSKDVDILMGTLSKSASSCGGYIAGSEKFINYLRYNSPSFIFSAGISPANTAAAYKSFEIFENDSRFTKKLKDNSSYFLKGVKEIGFDTGLSEGTQIIPLIFGNSDVAREFSNRLIEAGINALPIIYPAVKESEARIRFFISSLHTVEDLDYTLKVLEKLKSSTMLGVEK
ncbi:MAG: aminotransferase class I/II-fold pyridoxal phosphate-dependent enzyme [Streptococcaceae bacterium]|jgi:8-amino-7-oxononanoate synthase|nr:aminotransferase class I/II-fold pyridoxal phosphate-dependent enzyme [Streptococcaceae bacterium]